MFALFCFIVTSAVSVQSAEPRSAFEGAERPRVYGDLVQADASELVKILQKPVAFSYFGQNGEVFRVKKKRENSGVRRLSSKRILVPEKLRLKKRAEEMVVYEDFGSYPIKSEDFDGERSVPNRGSRYLEIVSSKLNGEDNNSGGKPNRDDEDNHLNTGNILIKKYNKEKHLGNAKALPKMPKSDDKNSHLNSDNVLTRNANSYVRKAQPKSNHGKILTSNLQDDEPNHLNSDILTRTPNSDEKNNLTRKPYDQIVYPKILSIENDEIINEEIEDDETHFSNRDDKNYPIIYEEASFEGDKYIITPPQSIDINKTRDKIAPIEDFATKPIIVVSGEIEDTPTVSEDENRKTKPNNYYFQKLKKNIVPKYAGDVVVSEDLKILDISLKKDDNDYEDLKNNENLYTSKKTVDSEDMENDNIKIISNYKDYVHGSDNNNKKIPKFYKEKSKNINNKNNANYDEDSLKKKSNYYSSTLKKGDDYYDYEDEEENDDLKLKDNIEYSIEDDMKLKQNKSLKKLDDNHNKEKSDELENNNDNLEHDYEHNEDLEILEENIKNNKDLILDDEDQKNHEDLKPLEGNHRSNKDSILEEGQNEDFEEDYQNNEDLIPIVENQKNNKDFKISNKSREDLTSIEENKANGRLELIPKAHNVEDFKTRDDRRSNTNFKTIEDESNGDNLKTIDNRKNNADKEKNNYFVNETECTEEDMRGIERILRGNSDKELYRDGDEIDQNNDQEEETEYEVKLTTNNDERGNFRLGNEEERDKIHHLPLLNDDRSFTPTKTISKQSVLVGVANDDKKYFVTNQDFNPEHHEVEDEEGDYTQKVVSVVKANESPNVYTTNGEDKVRKSQLRYNLLKNKLRLNNDTEKVFGEQYVSEDPVEYDVERQTKNNTNENNFGNNESKKILKDNNFSIPITSINSDYGNIPKSEEDNLKNIPNLSRGYITNLKNVYNPRGINFGGIQKTSNLNSDYGNFKIINTDHNYGFKGNNKPNGDIFKNIQKFNTDKIIKDNSKNIDIPTRQDTGYGNELKSNEENSQNITSNLYTKHSNNSENALNPKEHNFGSILKTFDLNTEHANKPNSFHNIASDLDTEQSKKFPKVENPKEHNFGNFDLNTEHNLKNSKTSNQNNHFEKENNFKSTPKDLYRDYGSNLRNFENSKHINFGNYQKTLGHNKKNIANPENNFKTPELSSNNRNKKDQNVDPPVSEEIIAPSRNNYNVLKQNPIVDQNISATSHKKAKPVNEKHEKGGGKESEEKHAAKHEEKGDKGSKSEHKEAEVEHGHHNKEGQSGSYKEDGGDEKKHDESSGYHAEHKEEDGGKKGATYNEDGEHKKGHSTHGSHNVHKKDEYEKREEFYDESDDEGDFDKAGGFFEESDFEKGGSHKESHYDEGDHHDLYGDEKHHEKGDHYSYGKSHKESDGHDLHHDHFNLHKKKEDEGKHKKWSYGGKG